MQTVIDALVADASAKIDEAVADGDLEADRAAELKENLPERITAFVNGELRGGPGGPGGPAPYGHGGPRGPRDGSQPSDAPADAPASESSTTS